jgi:hypothetical protein
MASNDSEHMRKRLGRFMRPKEVQYLDNRLLWIRIK